MKDLFMWLLLVVVHHVKCCTYVEQGVNGEFVLGRTMEFQPGLFSDIETLQNFNHVSIYPPGTQRTKVLVGSKRNGVVTNELKNKYLFVQLDLPYPDTDGNVHYISPEGMNEHGLSISGLVLDESGYEEIGTNGKGISIEYMFFTSWALGNYANVSDLVMGLDYVAISPCWSYQNEVCALFPRIHFSVADATGASAVVEFIGGEKRVYNNSVRTMTNDPRFPLQVNGLRHFKYLRNDATYVNGKTVQMLENDGVTVTNNAGYNMAGLPGDHSPESRFSMAYFTRKFAEQFRAPKTIEDAMVIVQGVINRVFIVYGTEPSPTNPDLSDYSDFATIRIPSQCKFMWRSYTNMEWKMVDLTDNRFHKSKIPHHRVIFDKSRDEVLAIASMNDEFFQQ